MEFLIALPIIGQLIFTVIVAFPLCGIAAVVESILEGDFMMFILGAILIAVSAPFIYDIINIFILK